MKKQITLVISVLVLALTLACGGSVGAPSYDVRDEVEIIKESCRRDTIIDNFIIEGEVENKGTHTWQFVKLSASGYDSNVDLVSTGTAYIDARRLRPGDISTFSISVEETEPIATYQVSVIDGSWEE